MNNNFTDFGNKNFYCANVQYGDSSKASDADKLESVDDLINDIMADALAGADGQYKKTDLPDGIQHLKVIPKWRKNTPNNNAKADNADKLHLSILSRVSTSTQEYVLNKIAELYTPDCAEQDKQIEIPKDFSDLDDVIDKGVNVYLMKQQASIDAIDTKKTSLKTQKSQLNTQKKREQYAVGMLKSSGVNESDIAIRQEKIADIESQIAKLDVQIKKLNDKQKSLEKEKSENQEKVSKIKEQIQEQIKTDLRPANAESIGEGYLYIFLKDSNVDGFGKLKLYREYKASIEHNLTNFAEVDISEYTECDYRSADADSASTRIQLPSCYAKDNQTYELEQVVVLFSKVQLSSARLDKIEIDSKLQSSHAQNLNISNLKDSFDMSLRENISFAKAKVRDIKYKYIDNSAKQADWNKLEVYPVLDICKSLQWNLLVNDPVGVMDHNNFAIAWCQTQLSKICVDIQADNYGKSSILIANFLFNPQMSGMLDVSEGKVSSLWTSFRTYDEEYKLQLKGLINSWLAKANQLKEVNRTKDTIDLELLKYNLRSNARSIMRGFMEAFQAQGLAWIDPTDKLIECWRDMFSVGAHSYGSSFERWFDTVNHLSIDPQTTDNLYDIVSDRPVDKLEIQSIRGIMLYSYTITSYEYHINYYKCTAKKFDAHQKLVSTDVSYIDKDQNPIAKDKLGDHIHENAPDGLRYMTRALKPSGNDSDPIRTWVANSLSEVTGLDVETFLQGNKPEVSELLVPSGAAADKAKGTYDKDKLALSNSIELVLKQAKPIDIDRSQFQEAVKKYSKQYAQKAISKADSTTSKAYKLADDLLNGKSVSSDLISLTKDKRVETAVISFVNKVHIRYVNHEFTKSLLSYKPQRKYFTDLLENSFELTNFFGSGEGSVTKILLSSKFDVNVTRGQEVSATLAKAARGRNISVEDRYYRGQTHFFLEENAYKEFQNQVHEETQQHLDKLKSNNLIDKEMYDDLKNQKTSLGSLRYQAITGAIESAYGAYSAINELNEELEKLQKTEGMENAIVCLGITKQIFEIQNNCVKVINEYNNFKLSNSLLKTVPCTELFGSMESKIKAGKARKKALDSLIKTNDVVVGTLGLGISTLQLIQSVRSLSESMNQNDEHVIRADIANFINSGATTLSSAKTIADTLKGAEKKGAEKIGESAADLLGRNTGKKLTEKAVEREAAITLVERLGIRAAAFLSIPYLGEVLLVIDIATTLWQMWEEANKDNIYQQWVKLSNLYP
ncbi:hypothetical protein LO80_01525 [Candidatus Francisella endociliophora]|uniref:Uncharacterized protein n=1 Tax=Candidatus Francisella endociliophora TaxID=653937 RepID=A0A097EMI4_9GAMM|nr:hypothetical protein [Francisella sp. FSC1006]AIT08784.1 hypothetical protein LO80_01525 [Francisella sp. FSC1006]